MLEGSTFTLALEYHLNNVYTIVLKSTIHEEYLKVKKENRYLVLKQVLSTIVLLYSPLFINLLSRLLYLLKATI
jgi:ACR3 family arsenite efflux pump ArsB